MAGKWPSDRPLAGTRRRRAKTNACCIAMGFPIDPDETTATMARGESQPTHVVFHRTYATSLVDPQQSRPSTPAPPMAPFAKNEHRTPSGRVLSRGTRLYLGTAETAGSIPVTQSIQEKGQES